jgi:predicted nuclease of restriction endonuclease-like (RecB) superfamily
VKARATKHKRSRSATLQAHKTLTLPDYSAWSKGIANLLDEARRQSARSINAVLTATYWELGRRIVKFEQQGKQRAAYGDVLLKRLSADLVKQFGKGFGWRNLFQMRSFYLAYRNVLSEFPVQAASKNILQTVSAISRAGENTVAIRKSGIDLAIHLDAVSKLFPLSWSHYVRLLTVEKPEARQFYEAEALRGGWSARQLDRQISTLFYERTALSRNKALMLIEGAKPRPQDSVSAEEEIKSPFVLEFLGLRDDYAESDLEEALVLHLESFLLELGNDFTFVARQKRIRIGKEWYRIDLLLFHRRLRCLMIVDLKVGRFTHADAGQMNLYVNYAAEHLTIDSENPPVGLVLCTEHDDAVAHYAMGNLNNKILAAQYRLNLPDPRTLEVEIEKTRRRLETQAKIAYNNVSLPARKPGSAQIKRICND